MNIFIQFAVGVYVTVDGIQYVEIDGVLHVQLRKNGRNVLVVLQMLIFFTRIVSKNNNTFFSKENISHCHQWGYFNGSSSLPLFLSLPASISLSLSLFVDLSFLSLSFSTSVYLSFCISLQLSLYISLSIWKAQDHF